MTVHISVMKDQDWVHDCQYPQKFRSSWQLKGWSRQVYRVGVCVYNWKSKASYCLIGCPQNCEFVFFFFYVESMSKLDLITKFLCENVSFSSFLCHVEMSEFSLQFRNCSDVIWTTSKGMKRKIICHYRKPLEWQCLPQCTIGFLFFWWCNYFYFMHIVFIYLFFWPICMSVWGCWIPGNWNNR